jgi:hypothetical protein
MGPSEKRKDEEIDLFRLNEDDIILDTEYGGQGDIL